MQLSVDDKIIVWPGRKSEKPEGFMIPTHLKVLTIEEKPFVYVRKLEGPGTCETDEIPCPHYNETHAGKRINKLYLGFLLLVVLGIVTAKYCCKGYCMDLLNKLSQKINFTYTLALSPDGQFGNYILRNKSGVYKKEWNGLIGELVGERADMIVAPLTINPERAEFIDFSKPFKYQGITILEKKVCLLPIFSYFFSTLTCFSHPDLLL